METSNIFIALKATIVLDERGRFDIAHEFLFNTMESLQGGEGLINGNINIGEQSMA